MHGVNVVNGVNIGVNQNNNTSFRAITQVKKPKGKLFKENPELWQNILDKLTLNEKYKFKGESVTVVAKSKDYSSFGNRMLYGITSDDPLIKLRTVELSFYEELQDNIFSKAWKHVKGFCAKYFSKKGIYSKAYREIAPYKVIGQNYLSSSMLAYEDLKHMLDIGATPSQHFQRAWYN